MNELIKVSYDANRPTVLGRDLHELLEVETRYNDWFPRMVEYGFAEGVDFYSFLSKTSEGGRPAQDHQLTIDMAKEICMLQRSEKGKQARQYFIQLEKDWNSPEKIMARALQIAEQELESLKRKNAALAEENELARPKAEYFDALVSRNLLTSFRETAKEFGVKEKKFIQFLIDKNYIFRNHKGKLEATAEKNNGLFEVKEFTNEKTGYASTQTLITPKGRETFRLLLEVMDV